MIVAEQIGRYRVERLIARTGLSEVFLAATGSGERVCIKRLASSAEGSRGSALSFRREATLLSQVAHPNVVKVLEVGDDGARPFIALEFVEGQTLADLVGASLSLDEQLELLEQLADALRTIHAREIVHRDLKPANLLVSTKDGRRTVKVADFGLADDVGLEGTLSGTPHYMAPEQTGMVDWPVDSRTDLYAFGVIAFELLTGRVPFDAADPAALILAHVSERPPKLGTIRPGLPPVLERLVLKLLEKAPSERYKSAASLLEDIRQLRAKLAAGQVAPELALDTAPLFVPGTQRVFVGREDELQELEFAFERTTRGQPCVVYIAGAAGSGKSTLLREFQNRLLTRGARFASGKCHEFSRSLPYFALSEALTDLLKGLQRAGESERERLFAMIREAAADSAGELVRMAPAFAALFPDAPPPSYTGEAQQRTRFIQMLARVVSSLATTDAPLVLLLEDLHWADNGTIEALEALTTGLGTGAVLVLATYRGEDLAPTSILRSHLDKAGRIGGVRHVHVLPLERHPMAMMVAEKLRVPLGAIPPFVIDRIYTHTGGNPLFVSTLLDGLVGAKKLRVEGGALVVTQEEFEAAALPTSLVDMVVERLRTLDASTRSVLAAGALVGSGLSLDLLASAAGSSPDQAFAAAEQAIRESFLVPPRAGKYRFVHDRVREACAGLVPAEQRAPVHARILAYLEAHGASDDPELPFELAGHAARANDHGRTWKYASIAGGLARERYANEQALGYLDMALEHVVTSGAPIAEQRKLRLERGRLLDLLGRYDEAIEQYRELEGASRAVEERSETLLLLSMSLQKSGKYAESRDHATEALYLLGVSLRESRFVLGFYVERARAWWSTLRTRVVGVRPKSRAVELVLELLQQLWHVYGTVDSRRGPYIAMRLLAEAIPFGPSRQLAAAHRLLAASLPQMPNPRFDDAVAHGARSVALAKDLKAPLDVGLSLVFTGVAEVWSTRYSEALATLSSAVETLSSAGNTFMLANAHIFSFLAHRASGHLDEALAHARALVDLGEKTNAKGTQANGHQKIADILLLKDERSKAEIHLERSLEIAEANSLKFDRYQAYKIRAFALLRESRWREARTHFEAAIKILESPGTSFFKAFVSDAYLGFALAFLRDEEAFGAERGAEGDTGRLVRRYIADALKREKTQLGHLGLAHVADGWWHARAESEPRARRAFLDAFRVYLKQKRPLDLAIARIEAASCLADTHPAEAAAWLRDARGIAEEIGAATLVRISEPLAKRLGVSSTDVRDGAAEGGAKQLVAIEQLARVSRLLMESTEIDVVLDRIVDSSLEVIGAERGFIFTRNDSSGALELRLGKGVGGERLAADDARVSKSVLERVFRTGQGVAVSDTEQDDILKERRSVVALNLRSVLCAPLVHADRPLGVLYLDSRITRVVFGPNELGVLTTIAAQAAVALANAVQFATIQQMNRDLDQKVAQRTRELVSANDQLTTSMNELRNTTLRLAEARKAALEKELEVARGIQHSIVPRSKQVYDVAGFKICGLLESASLCGGDFWTFIEGDEMVTMVIGDVTGHGVGSAMVTTVVKSCLDTLSLERGGARLDLESTMRTLSEVVFRATENKLTMTAFTATIDRRAREIVFCVAAHNPQLLVRPGAEEAELLPLFARSMRLGDGHGNTYEATTVPYQTGDRIVLFTDGLIELCNTSDVEYGMRRLRRTISRHARDDARTMLDAVYDDAMRFGAGRDVDDDVTAVVIELT
jgi:serine phosphatase RsbU (regulator of sigma subunit)/tetratricopeptide (TPR) repeat protein